MSRYLLALGSLVLIYALVLVSLHPWDLVVGAAVAGALLASSRRFVFGERVDPIARLSARFVAFVPFVVVVIWDILKGTWQVALAVLHLRPLTHPGLVALPIEERTRLGVVVATLTMTLSPGSVLIDVDWEKRIILMHFLDAANPDQIRADQRRFYQRYQRHVFP